MAIFHLHMQVIGRGLGSSKMVNGKVSSKSAMAAAAYRAGAKLIEKVIDVVTGKEKTLVHNYSNKGGIAYSEILAPEKISKDSWIYDRQRLWSEVQNREKRSDSQFAREFNIALPVELFREENIELLQDYVREVFVAKGMVADVNIHYDNAANPHAHVMLTMREIVTNKDGEVSFGLKNRSWNGSSLVLEARERWAKVVNVELAARGYAERISEKSYAELGIDLTPTKHEGPSRHMRGVIFHDNIETREENAQNILENPEIIIASMNKVVFTKADLEKSLVANLKEGMKEARDSMVASKYLFCLEKMMSSEELVRINHKTVRGEEFYTSSTQLKMEKEYIDDIKALNARDDFRLVQGRGTFPESLSSKQQEVVKAVLAGQNISIIEGLPGAGKTTVMKAIADSYKQAGYTVVGTSISSVATLNLQETAGIESRTVASWKYRFNQGLSLPEKAVFVIDEASMLDFDSAHQLLPYLQNSKVIMVGDTNQFGAIGIKGAMAKAVELCGALSLSEVKRQKNPLEREATLCLSRQNISRALELYAEAGAFKVSENNARRELVLDYVRDYIKDKDQLISGHVALAFTNEVVESLNAAIRAKLVEGKVIKPGVDINLGTSGKKLNLALGDQVIFCANDRNIGVLNGQLGVVRSIKLSKNRHGDLVIQLPDKEIKLNTADYSSIKHGFALTSHKSQGATYKTTKVLYEQYIKYHAFNVMMTRHTDAVGLYINRSELIAGTVGFKEQAKYRSSDLVLIKNKLLGPLAVRESALLASDYLASERQIKFEKVREFIDVKNDINRLLREDYIGLRLDPELAREFLSNLNKRDELANEIKSEPESFKEFIAASNLSWQLSELALNPDKKLDQILSKGNPKSANFELSQWYKEQRYIKEQVIKVKSKLILAQENFDQARELQKQKEYLQESCQALWNNGLLGKVYKEADHQKVVQSLDRVETMTLDKKEEAYAKLRQDPTSLGKMFGFDVLGLRSQGRQAAYKLIDEYLDQKIILTRAEYQLSFAKTEAALRQEIDSLQQKLQGLEPLLAAGREFAAAKEIGIRKREQLVQAKLHQKQMKTVVQENITGGATSANKGYLRFEDIKLTPVNYENLFKHCATLLNPQDAITKTGHEIKCGSLSMNVNNGLWQRFATGQSGNIFGLICEAKGMTKREALEWVAQGTNLIFDQEIAWSKEDYLPQYSSSQAQGIEQQVGLKNTWQQLARVPKGIELVPARDLSWMKQPVQGVYAYRDQMGALLGYTLRCQGSDGGKQILPLSYCIKDNRSQWMIKGFGIHLYGLEKLAASNKGILLVEGEKTADAAQVLFPELTVLAFPGTSRTVGIDWSVLQGREVTIWPDNDTAGLNTAKNIEYTLYQQNIDVKVINLKELGSMPEKWDLADKLPEELTVSHLRQAVSRTGLVEVQEQSSNRSRLTVIAVGLEQALHIKDEELGAKIVSAESVAAIAKYEPVTGERIVIAVAADLRGKELEQARFVIGSKVLTRIVAVKDLAVAKGTLAAALARMQAFSDLEAKDLVRRESFETSRSSLEQFENKKQEVFKDLTRFDPKYDLATFKAELAPFNDVVREAMLERELYQVLKPYVAKQEQLFQAEKMQSKSWPGLIEVFAREKEFCTSIDNKYGKLIWKFNYREKRDWVNDTLASYRKSGHDILESFSRNMKNLESLNGTLPQFSPINKVDGLCEVAEQTFKVCQIEVLKQIQPKLEIAEGDLARTVTILTEYQRNQVFAPYLQELVGQKNLEFKSFREMEQAKILDQAKVMSEPEVQKRLEIGNLELQTKQQGKEQAQEFTRGLELDR